MDYLGLWVGNQIPNRPVTNLLDDEVKLYDDFVGFVGQKGPTLDPELVRGPSRMCWDMERMGLENVLTDFVERNSIRFSAPQSKIYGHL